MSVDEFIALATEAMETQRQL